MSILDDGISFGLGVLTTSTFLSLLLIHCDNIDPYSLDATKIDMVKRGWAEWVVGENGDTEWRLIDTTKSRNADP